MKRSLLYISFFLLPLLMWAQAPTLPAYTLTGENTVCGGNIKVDWSAAVAASIPVSQWRTELYDSGGTKLAQLDFDTDGKAQFSDLSSGTYKVKIVKKVGTDTHPSQLVQAVTSSYRRFSLDMSATTYVRPTGVCTPDAGVTFKIKDGEGPFVVKLYRTLTDTTPIAISAPTAKTPGETAVAISGLAPNSAYYVEVTDQVGGGACSITEPRNVHRIVTQSAAEHFVRNFAFTSWRPKKTTEPARVEQGYFTVEINNTASGPGPFIVKVRDFDSSEVFVASYAITKGSGATTTAYVTPDGTKKFTSGKRYLLTVADGTCEWGKQVGGEGYLFSTKGLKMFLVPSCNNCNLFDLAVAADYTHMGARPTYFPFLLTVKIERTGSPTVVREFIKDEALAKRVQGKYNVYGNGNEFGYWNWWDPMIYKIDNYQVKPGDKITITYKDSNNQTQQIQHTVAPPTVHPYTNLNIGAKTSGTACDKNVLLKTYFQTFSNNAYYNAFCNVNAVQSRVKVGGSWTTATYKGDLFRYYNEVNNNEHIAVIANSAASTYQVEYATASGSLDGSTTKNCKHYLSQQFTQAQVNAINPLSNINLSVGGTPGQTLEEGIKGNKVYLGTSDPDSGQLDFFKANNKLTVKLERLDGKKTVKFNATGPWNLAGEYEVKFPYTKVLPEGNPEVIYQFTDVPIGQYKMTLSDQCPGRPAVVKTFTVDQVPSPAYTFQLVVGTSCASGGGVSKGAISLRATSLKNYSASLRSPVVVYKDLDNGQAKLHLRKGVAVKSANFSIGNDGQEKYVYHANVADLPPGKYLLGIKTGSYLYSVVDPTSARKNGYMYPNLPRPYDTEIYKEFEIENITDVTPVSVIGMCDVSNPNTGVIRVEMPQGSVPKYPITYTLYKVSGGVKTVVTQGGNEVKKVVNTKPTNFEDAFATFTNVPKLTGGDTYEVKFESGCLDRWVPVPDFGSLTAPAAQASVTQACFNQPMTFSVDLSESVYDIRWKADPADAFNGVPADTLKKATFSFSPQKAAKYFVTYKMKSNSGCPVVEKTTSKLEVPLKVTNFTDAAIGTLTDVTEIMPTNLCATTATWTAPTITDSEGCGYRLTWRVLDAGGNELYKPTADANGNTPATSWNGFKVGDSYVEYTVKGKADGGTEGKKRLKVTVTAPQVTINVTGKFVGEHNDAAAEKHSFAKGETAYYMVTVENTTTQRFGTSALKITLPDNTNGNYELPQATDSRLPGLLTQLGTGTTVEYDTNNPRVLIISNINGTVFGQNRKVNVFIPINIRNQTDCSQYENACSAVLTAKASLEYSTGNGCPSAGTKDGNSSWASIHNNDNNCRRLELFCGGTVNLTARGSGYTSYKWYSSADNGSTYQEIAGQTAATYAATAAGYYMVKKIVACEGVADTATEEYIRVISSTDANVDVIKEQAGGRGGHCINDNNIWVSHFLLCAGSSYTLRANFYQAGVQWQRANGCDPASNAQNCYQNTDSCWQTISTDYSYTFTGAGRYRLKVGSGACVKTYFFEVKSGGITAALEGQVTEHSALSLGAANLVMSTEGTSYKYTVKRVSDGAVLATNVTPAVDSRGSHYVKVPNLAVPNDLTRDNFDITLTPTDSALSNCSTTIRVDIPKTDAMTARVVFTNTWAERQCNRAKYDFTIVGGRRNYKYLIYKIDGQYAKRSYDGMLLDVIPDSEYTNASAPTNAQTDPPDKFSEWIEVPRKGKYIFLIKDVDDRVALTNEVQVGQTSKYAVDVEVTGLTCSSEDAGKITARFLDNTVPQPKIQLFKYKTDGTEDSSWSVQTNASGEFNNLSAGKYRVELSYLHSSVSPQIRCTVKQDVEVSSPAPIEASIGVVKDNTCTNNGKFLLKVNWVKGGVPGPGGTYSFMSTSGTGVYSTDREFYVDGGSESDPKIKVYVKDNNGCIAEVEVMAKKSLVKPTLSATPVTYDCAGNGTFTVTPTTPAGKTYTYEYSLDGAVRQSPNAAGNAILYTGIPGKAAAYVVRAYYKEPSTHPINELYKTGFGDLERLDASEGAPVGIGAATETGELSAGNHVVTKQLPSSAIYRSETGTGRYYAIHSGPGNVQLFVKELDNVVKLRAMSVKFRYINLGKNHQTQYNAPIRVVVEVPNPSGVGTSSFTKTVAAVSQAESWKTAEVTFEDLVGFNQSTRARLIIETTVHNVAIGLDDIEVTQPTETCQVGEPISVQVDPNKGFAASITQVEPPKCHGGKGKIYVKLTNPKPSSTYKYQLSGGTFEATPLVGTDKLEIEAPIGVHTLNIRMIAADQTYCQVATNETATIVDVPQLEIEDLTIQAKGCVAPWLTAGATVKVVHGTSPYTVQKKRPEDPDFVDVAASDITWTGSTGAFVGLDDNKSYQFRIKDHNGCLSPVQSYFVPAKIALTATANGTLCLSPGGTGTIIVDALTGNGGYEFELDNSGNWLSDPANPTEYEFENLAPRATPYKVQVRDALGCQLAAPIEITISEALEVGHTSDDHFDCNANPSEHIEIMAKGGNKISGAYRLEWKRGGQATDPTGYNPSTDNDGGNVQIGAPTTGTTVKYEIDLKAQGTYHFRLTDANGCEQFVTEKVEAQEPAFLSSPGLSGSEINCAGASDGVIGVYNGSSFLPIENAIDRSKGVAPYTIKIYHSNGTNQGTILTADKFNGQGLVAGYYYVELTDSKGCQAHQIVRVTEKAAPTLVVSGYQPERCTPSPRLGEVQLTLTAPFASDYRVGLYTDLDADGKPLTVANNYPGATIGQAKEDLSNSTGGVVTIQDLRQGEYYVAVTNLRTGCSVVLPNTLTIAGSELEITQTPGPAGNCNELNVILEFRERGGTINKADLEFAVYDPTKTYAAHTKVNPSTYDDSTPGVIKVPLTLQNGLRYQIIANYKGCTKIITPRGIPNGNSGVVTQNRKPNICGNDVYVDFTVAGLVASTNYDYALYTNPFVTTLPITATPIHSGTVTSASDGKARIQQTLTGLLQEGKSYTLVVRDQTTDHCMKASRTFQVAKAPRALAMDGTPELIKNSSCNTPENPNYSAQVRIKVKDGIPPYRYTITKVATDPVDKWAEPEVVTTNSPELVLDKTFFTTDKKITGTVSGDIWHVHVRDANDCWVTAPVTVYADDTAHIDEVEIENLCTPGTDFTLLVTMNKIGRGQHYYTFRPSGGSAASETARLPINFEQVAPNKWEGRISNVYADANARELRIYDQNVCVSNIKTFSFTGKPTYVVEQTRLISCRSGAAGEGQITVKTVQNVNTPNHNYVYRLYKEDSNGETLLIGNTALAHNPADFTLDIADAGKYRVEIVDLKYPNCPFARTIVVREKVVPIVQVQGFTDSKCFNPNAALGETNGGGSVTLFASPESIAGMKFTVKSARYADDDSTVSLDPTSLTDYQSVSASNSKVEITAGGRKALIKGLYGHKRGVIYTIEVEGNNECKTTTEVKILGVEEIQADMTKAVATQFKCSADQELVAKLELESNYVKGGSGVYRYTLIDKATGQPVDGNVELTEPKFRIDNQAGGTYTLRVKDAQYNHCDYKDFDFLAAQAIDPFVKVTQVMAAEVQDITCQAGEKVSVTANLAPTPTKDVRITLSMRNVADGSHQSKTLTVAAGNATVSHTFDNVPMGSYSITALNEETGCIVYGTAYEVQDPNTFSLTATLEKPVKCYGTATGSITFTLADLDLSNSAGVDQATEGYTLEIKSITRPTDPVRTEMVAPGSATKELTDLKYGAYTVTATSTSTGCVTKIPANFTIRQADQPINLAAELKIPDDCSATGSAEISIEITGGVAPYKVTMTGDNGHTQTVAAMYNRWLFIEVPGSNSPGATFEFKVEDAWGCVMEHLPMSKKVVKPDPIDFDPPQIPMVSCRGVEDAEIVIENARGGAYDDPTEATPKTTYYYELYHSERGAIRPLQTSNKFDELPAGNYTLVVRDRWNCEKQQQFTISNPPEVKVTKVDGSNLVCYGDTSGFVKINVTGGTPTIPKGSPSGTPAELIYKLELVEADTDVVTNTFPNIRTSMLPYTITGLTPGVNYRVRASDGKQCPGESDLFALTAAPNLDVKASYEDTCRDNAYDGDVVITFDDGTVDYSKVRYSFDGGATRYNFSSGSASGAQVRINRNHTSVNPSSLPQTIKLYYTEGTTTCEGETTPVVVPVIEQLSLIKDPSTTGDLNELRLLGKNGIPGYVYYFNGVHRGSEGTYIVRIQDPEGVDPSDNKLKKRIEAKVEDSKGCTAQEVYYIDYVDIEIPRFFTPNGDGENDVWWPHNSQQYPNILTQIYDRYGRLLKELTRGQRWDGTYNGKALPTGDYWYIITLGEEDDSREFKGHFTLFR
ncbi:hypothetical protein HMPREF1551_02114 [Capnocytophaga sp. oral taxon 863 str. F0517]|uniref:T9SS type B sorting domain-containing protein n=1 Tax=Capnocytophaga sp. oral taxon 863 TaxID=1227265 RepID=UPI0003966CE7|nr:T9SS type B sorting domain-containing protein [Capnocytophaga sp. oral taxon 863]ERI62116.1 hypothetical protein HMPREF1551_02114 [Capnocytophaga sp. oral taxon 863 str. F0517]